MRLSGSQRLGSRSGIVQTPLMAAPRAPSPTQTRCAGQTLTAVPRSPHGGRAMLMTSFDPAFFAVSPQQAGADRGGFLDAELAAALAPDRPASAGANACAGMCAGTGMCTGRQGLCASTQGLVVPPGPARRSPPLATRSPRDVPPAEPVLAPLGCCAPAPAAAATAASPPPPPLISQAAETRPVQRPLCSSRCSLSQSGIFDFPL